MQQKPQGKHTAAEAARCRLTEKRQIINFKNDNNMKKIFFFIAAAGLLTFASCQKLEQDFTVTSEAPAQEIAITPLAGSMTKTIIEGTEFPTTRGIVASAYLNSGTGYTGSDAYFSNVSFSYNETNKDYRPANAYYWPLTGTLTINAISADESTTVTPTWTSATKFSYTCADVQPTQDILVAVNSAASNSSKGLTFKHTGALIEVKAKASAAFAENRGIEITGVTLVGIKPSTTVTVENGTPSAAEASGTTADRTIASNATNKLSGSLQAIGSKIIVPANQNFTSLKIDYKLYNGSNSGVALSLTKELGSGTWELGKKYTYEITATLNEISVTGSVTDWVGDTTGKDVQI